MILRIFDTPAQEMFEVFFGGGDEEDVPVPAAAAATSASSLPFSTRLPAPSLGEVSVVGQRLGMAVYQVPIMRRKLTSACY
jgi:hypothetical protein